MKQSLRQALKLLCSLPGINRDIRRLQRVGYPIKNFLQLISNDRDTETIVYTSPEFQPCAESFSENIPLWGPWLYLRKPPSGKMGTNSYMYPWVP